MLCSHMELCSHPGLPYFSTGLCIFPGDSLLFYIPIIPIINPYYPVGLCSLPGDSLLSSGIVQVPRR